MNEIYSDCSCVCLTCPRVFNQMKRVICQQIALGNVREGERNKLPENQNPESSNSGKDLTLPNVEHFRLTHPKKEPSNTTSGYGAQNDASNSPVGLQTQGFPRVRLFVWEDGDVKKLNSPTRVYRLQQLQIRTSSVTVPRGPAKLGPLGRLQLLDWRQQKKLRSHIPVVAFPCLRRFVCGL